MLLIVNGKIEMIEVCVKEVCLIVDKMIFLVKKGDLSVCWKVVVFMWDVVVDVKEDGDNVVV